MIASVYGFASTPKQPSEPKSYSTLPVTRDQTRYKRMMPNDAGSECEGRRKSSSHFSSYLRP